MRNTVLIILVTFSLTLSFFCLGYVFGGWMARSADPIPYYVTDKAEANGKCYVETWLEVTPEEYIGLDIGDEWEIRE